ncbi:MAG: acyltransferase [Muribaculaceae bacterium]|nr:acyltransferase [Muribaculaceae bacterium]
MQNQTISDKISCGRLAMTLGVVIIHCNVMMVPDYDGSDILTGFFDFVLCMTDVCVPWFFFISGYLLVHRHPDTDWTCYKSLVYRRVRSILIPYLLWNTIAFLIRAGINLSPLGQFTNGRQNFDSITGFVMDVYVQPELMPLWFLRNLFIFVLVSPVIRYLVRFNAIVALILLWVSDHYFYLGGILYYGMGFIFAKNYSPDRFDKWLAISIKMLPFVLLLTFAINLFSYDLPVIGYVLIFFQMLGIWGLACRFITSTGIIDRPDNMFFIYAAHGIVTPYLLRTLSMIFDFSGYYWLVCYVASVIIVIGTTFGAALVFKSISPNIYALLTGYRYKKSSPL